MSLSNLNDKNRYTSEKKVKLSDMKESIILQTNCTPGQYPIEKKDEHYQLSHPIGTDANWGNRINQDSLDDDHY